MSVVAAAVVVLIVFVLTRHRFIADNYLWVSTTVLALSITQVGQTMSALYEGDGRAARIGSLGARMFSSILALLGSVAATVLAVDNANTAAEVMTIVAGALVVGAVFGPVFLGQKIASLDARIDVPSSHLSWADELRRASPYASSSEIQEALEQCVDKLRFVARDVPGASEMNDQIDSCVARLCASVRNEDSGLFFQYQREFEQLIAEREVVLRSLRRRA